MAALLRSHRIVWFVRSHFQGMMLATLSANASFRFTESTFFWALCRAVLSMQKMSTESFRYEGQMTTS